MILTLVWFQAVLFFGSYLNNSLIFSPEPKIARFQRVVFWMISLIILSRVGSLIWSYPLLSGSKNGLALHFFMLLGSATGLTFSIPFLPYLDFIVVIVCRVGKIFEELYSRNFMLNMSTKPSDSNNTGTNAGGTVGNSSTNSTGSNNGSDNNVNNNSTPTSGGYNTVTGAQALIMVERTAAYVTTGMAIGSLLGPGGSAGGAVGGAAIGAMVSSYQTFSVDQMQQATENYSLSETPRPSTPGPHEPFSRGG